MAATGSTEPKSTSVTDLTVVQQLRPGSGRHLRALFRPEHTTALIVLTVDGSYAIRQKSATDRDRHAPLSVMLLDLLRRRVMNVWLVDLTPWTVEAGLLVRQGAGASAGHGGGVALPVSASVVVRCRVDDPAELARAMPSGRISELTDLVRRDLVTVLDQVRIPPVGGDLVVDYPRQVALAVREQLPTRRSIAGAGIGYGECEVRAEYEGSLAGQAEAADEAQRELRLEKLRLQLEEMKIDFYRRIVSRGEDWVLALSLHQGADPGTVLRRMRERSATRPSTPDRSKPNGADQQRRTERPTAVHNGM